MGSPTYRQRVATRQSNTSPSVHERMQQIGVHIVTTDQNPEIYDPDAPPESSFIKEFIGVLVSSKYVTPETLKELEPRAQEQILKYWGERTPSPLWYLEAHGLSVQRSDGQPFRQTDLIALTGKDGKWLSKGQSPDVLAKAYSGLGVSASYLRVGQPDSAVGRVFHFQETEVKLGRTFKKTFSLYPLAVMPPGYTFDGEVTVIDVKQDDGTEGAAPATVATLNQDEVTNLLRAALSGKAPAEMFDAILSDSRLKAVGTVFGVNLMEAATDESLTEVLAENKVLVVGADGKFTVPLL